MEADRLLLAFRRRADQHQHAFAVVFHAGLQEDAVRPHVHVPARRQIALLGKDAPNLSPAVISRLTAEWQGEYERWQLQASDVRRLKQLEAENARLKGR
jgi:hypothetical protein